MATNVPKVTWSDTGFIIPSSQAVLEGALEDLNAAFGGVLNLGLTTPQGQIASSNASVIDYAYQLFQTFTNQVDPAYASGRMQDAIGNIYFLNRIAATSTVVTCTCGGLAGVVIPSGALAQGADGTLYSCVSGGTIGIGGTVSLSFAATTTGPISAPAGTVNQIYQAINGWDTVANPADGVAGGNVETRAEFEARRVASVAANSQGILGSVLGAVLAVPGVIDAYVTENVLATSATIGGAFLFPNSIFVSVVGGSDLAVATAIWSKKSPGCSYNGNTTITVTDPNPAYTVPPSYAVTFTRPAEVTIPFTVTIANSAGVPSDATAQIRAAIVSAFAGGDGGPRQKIGTTVYASRYYGPVAMLGPWAQIISIKVGSPLGNSVPTNIDQVPVVAAGDITVVLV